MHEARAIYGDRGGADKQFFIQYHRHLERRLRKTQKRETVNMKGENYGNRTAAVMGLFVIQCDRIFVFGTPAIEVRHDEEASSINICKCGDEKLEHSDNGPCYRCSECDFYDEKI
jgi:hypothetical protein